MQEYLQTAYGKVYLTQERYREFVEITSKHLSNLLLELKEHKIIPTIIALEKTSVYELDFLKQQEKSQQ